MSQSKNTSGSRHWKPNKLERGGVLLPSGVLDQFVSGFAGRLGFQVFR